ncbi:MAG: hypothetical protein LHW48_06945 [Candidatus Cloacimonetes bacterium]|nr:hypothetical protein [Candidatus Cloacimonadota bacterium]
MKRTLLLSVIMLTIGITTCFAEDDIYSINGSLGVGIAYPTEKLEVKGSIKGGIVIDDGSGSVVLEKNYMLSPDSLVFSWRDGSSGNYWSTGFHKRGINSKLYYDFVGHGITPNPGFHGSYDFIVLDTGRIGIGSDEFPTGCRLAVNGKVYATEINVKTYNNGWPDHVFKENYDLMSLNEVESFISKNGHLPGIPSAEQVSQDGINISEVQAMLLQKIEELTLHVIELKKENESLKVLIQDK